jgi:hypothetical protein
LQLVYRILNGIKLHDLNCPPFATQPLAL